MLFYLWSPWRMKYIETPKTTPGCVFCSVLADPDDVTNLVVARGERVFVILNRYPYTTGHIMVVPADHQPSLEKLDPFTRAEMMELVTFSIQVLELVYHPQGINVGINIGEAAGAGITDHVHMHVVPRWLGDTNFMSALGMTRVLPETLEDTYQRLKTGWDELENKS
jgi:ATP adenylyltransferase